MLLSFFVIVCNGVDLKQAMLLLLRISLLKPPMQGAATEAGAEEEEEVEVVEEEVEVAAEPLPLGQQEAPNQK